MHFTIYFKSEFCNIFKEKKSFFSCFPLFYSISLEGKSILNSTFSSTSAGLPNKSLLILDMQTKKRNPRNNSSREYVRSRISRAQRNLSENAHVSESNVTELITSSARKQKPGTTLMKKKCDSVTVTDLDTGFVSLPQEETSLCLESESHSANNASSDCQGDCNMGSGNMLESLFSPGFHTSKSVAGENENGVDFRKSFHRGDQHISHNAEADGLKYSGNHFNGSAIALLNAVNSSNSVDMQNYGGSQLMCFSDLGSDMPSEVSAIYVAVKNSKLECVAEHGEDDMYAEEEVDEEEIDDFDPYLFIKNLPALSSVVPAFRPVLLPKQTRSCPLISLVLDLDETLVHSMLEPCPDADFSFPVSHNFREHTVYVKCRPHLKDFMERVSGLFEIIVFTASQSVYAEQLLNVLDPKRRIFRHRVYRESCVFVEGNYLKDLSVLGRDLSRVAIIDNSPQAFGFQVENGIPIESWYDDTRDEELVLLLPFLERLACVDDVRPLIESHFKLRQKVEAAT